MRCTGSDLASLARAPARGGRMPRDGHGTPARNPPARSRSVRLDVTRDTWVSEVGQEADGNNGGAPRLKLKSIQEMSLVDIDAAPLRGPDDPIGRAPSEEGRRRAARAGDGQQRRGRVVRGDRQRLRGPAGRRDVPPSPASRPPLVDRRRRPLPRDPGQRRHDLADGRRLAARSRRLAARAGRPAGRGGPRGRPQPRLPRLRRHRLGVDPNRRDVHAPALSQSVCLQPRAEPGECPVFHGRARAGRSPAAGGPERSARRARDGAPAGRRGAGLVGHAPRRRPGRHARVLRDARRPRAAARADPAGRRRRASGSRCTCAT